jgi:hypothetical protein
MIIPDNRHLLRKSFIFTIMAGKLKHIRESIQNFEQISLEEMDAVKMMNRTDTKYVFHAEKLKEILANSMEGYQVLQIDEHRIFQYNSLYFDTEGLDLYLDHHNGKRPRYKVRFREYVETGAVFLEIKRKTSKEQTRKSRIPVDTIEKDLSGRSKKYIEKQTPLQAAMLAPALWTIFQRLTLVGKRSPERITIDHDVLFRHEDRDIALPSLAICEVKRDSLAGTSEFMKLLKNLNIYPGTSSKYCLGTIMLNNHVKYNRFKSNVLKINRLENDYRSYPAAG